MKSLSISLVSALAVWTSLATATVLPRTQDDSAPVNSVQVDGYTYTNYGLVSFGRISNAAVDQYGESLGGLGSAIALQSFTANKDGSYSASILLQPDRGHNEGGSADSDYRSRSHTFSCKFTELSTTATTPAAENLQATYQSTLLYKNVLNYTTGLDPDRTRQEFGQTLPLASFDNHLPIDAEGLVIYNNYLFTSDEYGPYIYMIDRATGEIVSTITPPAAIVPMINGKDNFTALVNPDTGRVANAGFEGLTFDSSTNTLWAILQAATVQDGGGSDTTSSHVRLLGWQISLGSLLGLAQPQLKYEYVVSLPQSNKGKTRKTSELHFVQQNTFLILPRDGNGFGDTSSSSTYKNAALISTTGATNIAGTKYDSPSNPVSPGGALVSGVTAIPTTDFVSFVDSTQLAKFGLHTGGAFDQNLIASKLESLALTSVQDSTAPNDYFLFTVSDNDFITTSGRQAGQVNGAGPYVIQDYADPYAVSTGNQDTQIFVYRISITKS